MSFKRIFASIFRLWYNTTVLNIHQSNDLLKWITQNQICLAIGCSMAEFLLLLILAMLIIGMNVTNVTAMVGNCLRGKNWLSAYSSWPLMLRHFPSTHVFILDLTPSRINQSLLLLKRENFLVRQLLNRFRK